MTQTEDNKGLSVLAGFDLSCQNPYQIKTLAEIEQAYVEMAIDLCEGNIPEAAKCLGVSPSTIYRKKAVWDSPESLRGN